MQMNEDYSVEKGLLCSKGVVAGAHTINHPPPLSYHPLSQNPRTLGSPSPSSPIRAPSSSSMPPVPATTPIPITPVNTTLTLRLRRQLGRRRRPAPSPGSLRRWRPRVERGRVPSLCGRLRKSAGWRWGRRWPVALVVGRRRGRRWCLLGVPWVKVRLGREVVMVRWWGHEVGWCPWEVGRRRRWRVEVLRWEVGWGNEAGRRRAVVGHEVVGGGGIKGAWRGVRAASEPRSVVVAVLTSSWRARP